MENWKSQTLKLRCSAEPPKTLHRACFALEITARLCSAATGHSKSLLARAAKPSHTFEITAQGSCLSSNSTRKHCTGAVFVRRRARNHCSGVLGRHRPFEILARACSKSLSARSLRSSKSLVFRQYFRVSSVHSFELY